MKIRIISNKPVLNKMILNKFHNKMNKQKNK